MISKKSQIYGISTNIDKRSAGYKRRLEALQKAPEQIPNIINRAINAGIDASYVLMDTWFTHQSLIKDQGLDVIGMVKTLNQRYLVGNERVSLKELYRLVAPMKGKNLIRSIHTTQANGVAVKVVFVRNRTKKSDFIELFEDTLKKSNEKLKKNYSKSTRTVNSRLTQLHQGIPTYFSL